MATEGSPVCGGVTLLHTEHEGKHLYEVKGFLNYNKGMFTSKGDKILMINNINVENLTPNALADLLVEGSPLLVIHHPSKPKPESECKSDELHVMNKESTVMSFSLAMVTESELESCVDQEPSDAESDDEIEDDCFSDDSLLIVSMEDTSYNVVVARGCDLSNPCHDCGMTNCEVNEVIVLPTKAEKTCNPAKILSLHREKKNLYLKSFLKEKYITPRNRQICLNNTMSAPINIYSYRVNSVDNPGVPVVLNFSGTQNFFSCTTMQGADTRVLTVVTCSKSDLQKICADDKQKWSLVFYMSSGPNNARRFESALHRGWFIFSQNVSSFAAEVEMHKDDERDSKPVSTFFVIIENC